MEQVNAKRAVMFVVAACLVGMVVGSAVTLAVLKRTYSISNVAQVKAAGVDICVFLYHSANLRIAFARWEKPFFSSIVISANVFLLPEGSKTGSNPKPDLPVPHLSSLAILPAASPSKHTGVDCPS